MILMLDFSLSATLAGGYKKHDNHQNDARIQEIAKFATDQVFFGSQRLLSTQGPLIGGNASSRTLTADTQQGRGRAGLCQDTQCLNSGVQHPCFAHIALCS